MGELFVRANLSEQYMSLANWKLVLLYRDHTLGTNLFDFSRSLDNRALGWVHECCFNVRMELCWSIYHRYESRYRLQVRDNQLSTRALSSERKSEHETDTLFFIFLTPMWWIECLISVSTRIIGRTFVYITMRFVTCKNYSIIKSDTSSASLASMICTLWRFSCLIWPRKHDNFTFDSTNP